MYGLGRFLRLSMTNLRLTIPYEELPSTRRLVTLCQVSVCAPQSAGRAALPSVPTPSSPPHPRRQDLYIARAQGELALEEALYKVRIGSTGGGGGGQWKGWL